MKTLVFDTGPIISFTMNNLTWLLPELKKKFQGNFYIPESVKKELIDAPLSTKRFKFGALQAMQLVDKGVLKIIETKRIHELAEKLEDLGNKIFSTRRGKLKLLHFGEMETIQNRKSPRSPPPMRRRAFGESTGRIPP